MRRRHAVSLAVLILAGSLAAAPAPATAASSPFLMLQVRLTGGFIPQEFLFDRVPTVAVYSDGTVLSSQVATTAIYPGPAAPTILRKMAKADLGRIMQAAAAAKLTDPKFDFGNPPVADAPATEVTWRFSQGGATFTRAINALGIGDYGLTKEQSAARNAAQGFIDALSGFSGKLIWTKSMPTPWVSSRWLYSAAVGLPDEMSVVRPWIGPALGKPVMCSAFTSAQNTKLRALLPKLNQATRWLSGRQTWQVRLRPLLPHESDCADVFR